jgi:Lanthionine synthetase C-like protein
MSPRDTSRPKSKTLYDPERHAPLSGAPWDPAAAQAAIDEIVADTRAAYDPGRLWPAHPLDDGVRDGSTTLYFGAAGVFWALRYLGQALEFDLEQLAARNAREYEAFGAYPNHASFLMGDVGVLLLGGPSERLRDRIANNIDLPPKELLWGMPGTMLAARFIGEKELYRRQVERLLAAFVDTPHGPLCVQELYGEHHLYLGPAHGFAGHMLTLIRGWEWLDAAQREWVSSAAMRTLSLNARESSDGVNWAAGAEDEAPALVQWCHGAPGIVISFADAPFASPELDRLLARAGELVWRAGPLAKGPNLCHGTAGNGYAFLKLYERSGEPLWLDRARAFAMTAIEQCRAARRKYGQGRHSLWTGDPGVAVYLHDCLRAAARFPTIDVF